METFHDEIETPGNHAVHLPLSMTTAVDNGSANFDLRVTVEPLLAQHRNDHNKEAAKLE